MEFWRNTGLPHTESRRIQAWFLSKTATSFGLRKLGPITSIIRVTSWTIVAVLSSTKVGGACHTQPLCLRSKLVLTSSIRHGVQRRLESLRLFSRQCSLLLA